LLEDERWFPSLTELRARVAVCLRANADSGQRMNETKNVQEPNHHTDHHNRVQDGLDRAGHRNEVVDEPEQNTYPD
jgi:hypothetical protein